MARQVDLRPTEPINAERHDREAFFCGVDSLDRYLKQQARKEAEQNIAQTFVLTTCERTDRILAYYTLSANRIKIYDLAVEMRKKLPKYEDVGVTLLGRFAVCSEAQRSGLRLGEHLLTDAKLKSWQAARVVASFGMIVNVLVSEKGDPTGFYLKYDFKSFPDNPKKLYLPMISIQKTLAACGLI